VRLARTDRIGPVAFSQLLGRYGSAVRAVEALPDLIRKSGAATLPPSSEAVERELAAGDRLGARLLVLGDADYRRCWPNSIRPRPSCGPVAARRF
jgi:DNA processing protein